MNTSMRLWNLLVASALFLSMFMRGAEHPAARAAADPAIDISVTHAITQNFDGLGFSALAALPDAWGVSKDGANVRSVAAFPSATFVTERLGGNGMSTTAANGIYNFGAGDAASATDRAVGFLSSSSATKSGSLYAHWYNRTGSPLSGLTVSYQVEKYRSGSNPGGFAIQLYFSLDGTTWTSAGSTFNSLFAADADNSGFASAPGAVQVVTNQPLNAAIPNNHDFYLAWNYSVASGTTTSNAQGLGIDDVSILGVAAAGATDPSGVGAAHPDRAAASVTATLLSVNTSPGGNPASTNLAVSCDLSAIGGLANQPLLDNGLNGDDTAGDGIFSYAATPAANRSAGAKNLQCTIQDDQGRSGSVTISLTIYVISAIGAVNGAIGSTSDATAQGAAMNGQSVSVRGVIFEKTLEAIKASNNAYHGFFIQNTFAQADGDPNSSDGLYVFMNTNATMSGPNGSAYTPSVGDAVILAGTVSDYYKMTELTSPVLVQLEQSSLDIDAAIPAAAADPPVNLADANRYWERRQGMRTQVPQDSQVVSGRSVFSPSDGEIWVMRPDSAAAQRADPYARRAFRDAHPLDDNYSPTNWDGNGYRILMGSLGLKAAAGDANALINPGRTFDTVSNAPAGGVNYTFNKYRIEITQQPAYSLGPDPAANQAPVVFNRILGFSIADYNLENLYDYRDNPFSGCDFTGGSNSGCSNSGTPFTSAVSSPYDYVPASDAEYQARLNDIALQIINDLRSPDLLMVQEVENQDICTLSGSALACGASDNADGKPDALQELALKISANGGPAYDTAWDRDSADLRGIEPAFLFRSERVQRLPAAGDPLLGQNPAIDSYTGVAANADVSNPKSLNAVLPDGISACETSWVFPRAPLAGLFRIYQNSIDSGKYLDIYVINNHFKSSPDSCVAHRSEQARYNAALIAFLQAARPEAGIVMGGDLNVYPRPDDPVAPLGQPGSTDQLESLYAPALGMTNLWNVLAARHPEAAYSYVYLGMAQTLDQIFANRELMKHLNQVQVAHINADFSVDDPGDGARGTSDHDPTVAVFSFEENFRVNLPVVAR
jgi:predicted extracellular nuclease